MIDPDLLVWARRGGYPDSPARVPDDQLPEVLDCAVGYALGRMTYAATDVARYVRLSADQLPAQHCARLAARIGGAVEGRRAGMEGDLREWVRAVDALTHASVAAHSVTDTGSEQ